VPRFTLTFGRLPGRRKSRGKAIEVLAIFDNRIGALREKRLSHPAEAKASTSLRDSGEWRNPGPSAPCGRFGRDDEACGLRRLAGRRNVCLECGYTVLSATVQRGCCNSYRGAMSFEHRRTAIASIGPNQKIPAIPNQMEIGVSNSQQTAIVL
jgi:hypothetical protein